MFDITNFEYTYQRIKLFMSYCGFKYAMHILTIICCSVFAFILLGFGIMSGFMMNNIWLSALFNGLAVLLMCILFSVIFLEFIWVRYQRNRKIYYLNESSYNFVQKYNGRFLYFIFNYILPNILSLLSPIIYVSLFVWLICSYIPDIYYLYEYNNKSESEYKTGHVYKFVQDDNNKVHVYLYDNNNQEDMLVYEFNIK